MSDRTTQLIVLWEEELRKAGLAIRRFREASTKEGTKAEVSRGQRERLAAEMYDTCSAALYHLSLPEAASQAVVVTASPVRRPAGKRSTNTARKNTARKK